MIWVIGYIKITFNLISDQIRDISMDRLAFAGMFRTMESSFKWTRALDVIYITTATAV